MKYQKKPITVEAFQWGVDEVPMWFMKHNGVRRLGKNLRLKVSDGWIMVYPDDFIILGVHGEIYSRHPDIFEETYVKVNDTDRISPDDIIKDLKKAQENIQIIIDDIEKENN